MFEVGFSELLVIFALALVVLGPERLPKLAAQVGRWIGRARAMARQFREQLEAEASAIDAAANVQPQRNSTESPQPPPSYAAADAASGGESSPAASPADPADTATEQETTSSTVSMPSEPSQPEPSREQRGG